MEITLPCPSFWPYQDASPLYLQYIGFSFKTMMLDLESSAANVFFSG